MKRSNLFFLILIFFTLSSCTKEKIPHSLATAYQSKYLTEDTSVIRNVASVDQPKTCFESTFNITTLQKEVFSYERKVVGTPVRGTWKHLNLEDLPIAQANFLKKFGESIGDLANPDSINYEGCNTLPCIFNRIYQRSEFDIAGYVHYLWYLKFGNYLSLDNKVYNQNSPTPGIYNGKQFLVKDYLYNDVELYGLWRIMNMLQDPYTNLTNLFEVQRIPRNEALEGYNSSTCGLASSAGAIRLSDKCLDPRGYDSAIRAYTNNKGFLYVGLIHEMSHLLDYLQAKQRNIRGFNRSEEQDYIDLIGFKKQEYTDANGALVSGWVSSPNSKTIRDYAGTSPSENFADTLAFFRQDGNEAKKKLSETQFQWTSNNYFHNENYDSLGNREWLLKKYETNFTKEILTKITDCFTTKRTFQSNYFTRNDFLQSKLSSNMFNCISFEAEAISKKWTAHIQTYEPDGCGTTLPIKNQENLWDLAVKQSLKKQFGIYIEEINNDPKYLAKVINFKLTLKDRSMANQSIFECYTGSTLDNLSSCYELKALEKSKSAAIELRFPEEQAQEMANLYLSNHPYSVVAQDLYLSYRNILNAHESFIRTKTDELWQMCLDLPLSDDLKPSGMLFSPRKGYLISSIYNCLNSKLPTVSREVVNEVAYDGQKISHPVEELIMLEFLAPRIIERLHEIHESSMNTESGMLSTYFAENSDEIKNNLLSDFSWVMSLNEGEIIKSCMKESLVMIKYLPLFQLKSEAFNEIVMSSICREIIKEPLLEKYLNNSKIELETNVFSQVETILEVNAEKRALSCLDSIPWKWERTKATVRIPRKTCLNLGRQQIETNTLTELMNIPLTLKFGINEYELKSKISESYDGVRSKVEEEHF